PFTVARRRIGVASGDRPRIRAGATTMRAPLAPGLSTSTTQASITVGSDIAGAIGAATRCVRTLAVARPPAKQASSNSDTVHGRPSPARRAPTQPRNDSTAVTTKGQDSGSTL